MTHFEIYGEEPEKLAEFYRSLFGWHIDKAPGVDYWWIQTATGQAKAIGGGLTLQPTPGLRSWIHYVHVNSLDKTLARLVKLHGTVVRPKTAVPKTAWYAVVADPEGSIFAIWETDLTAMPPSELG